MSNSSDTITALWGNNGGAPAYTTNGEVWSANYTGVWHLADGASLSGADSSAYNNDGTLSGSVGATAGAIGGAANFPKAGDLDHIDIPDLNMGTVHSVAFWISCDSPNAVVIGGANPQYAPYINGATVYYNDGGGSKNVAASGFSSTQWDYIVIVRNNMGVKFYQNGAQIGATKTLNSNTEQTLRQFSGYSSGGFDLDGDLGEIRFSSVIRSGDWIAASYSNQVPGSQFLDLGNPRGGTGGTILLVR